jgi:hypothetical protein
MIPFDAVPEALIAGVDDRREHVVGAKDDVNTGGASSICVKVGGANTGMHGIA